MKRQRVITTILAGWGLLVIGLASAQAAPIAPVSPSSSGVTIQIFRQDGSDVTDSYLPAWSPTLSAGDRTVYLVVNGVGTPSLVDTNPAFTVGTNPFLAGRTTSHYPGNCTNFGTDAGPDFALGAATQITISGGPTTTAYTLTSNDCGGMAVIAVGSDRFIVPRDANLNGMPDSLEAFGVALTPEGDTDVDGISAFDELRGFILGGQQIRTNPTVKNTFVFLVKPQCGSQSLLGGGTVTYPVSGAGSLMDYVLTVIPPPATVPPGISSTQVHFLGNSLGTTPTLQTSEWVDHFVQFSIVNGKESWQYCPNPNVSPCSANVIVVPDSSGSASAIPAGDRAINKNRVYGSQQKGLRATECLDASATTPFGTGRWGSPNGRDEAVIYTQRMVNYVNSIGSSTDSIYYSTFKNGKWQDPKTDLTTSLGAGAAARNLIISKTIQYVIAMEIAHTLHLTSSITSPTFPHTTTGSGSILDAAMRAVTSGTPTGVKFYIPSAFVGSSQTQLAP